MAIRKIEIDWLVVGVNPGGETRTFCAIEEWEGYRCGWLYICGNFPEEHMESVKLCLDGGISRELHLVLVPGVSEEDHLFRDLLAEGHTPGPEDTSKTPGYYGSGDGAPWGMQREMQSTGNVFVDARRSEAIQYAFRIKDDPVGDLRKAAHCLEAAADELEKHMKATSETGGDSE